MAEEKQNMEQQSTEPRILKTITISYFSDGKIDLSSEGEEQSKSLEEIYDDIYELRDIIKEKKLKDIVRDAAFRGAQQVFTAMASMKMKQENEDATKTAQNPNETPTFQKQNKK